MCHKKERSIFVWLGGELKIDLSKEVSNDGKGFVLKRVFKQNHWNLVKSSA